MKYTCIFGGTFDPPHSGHIKLAEYALRDERVEKLVIVPAAVSPFKQSKKTASNSQRLEMCRLAFGGLENTTVSDIEFTLPLPSYTVNTLNALKALYPGRNLALLLGGDAIMGLDKWKNYREILSSAAIFTAARDDFDKSDISKKIAAFKSDGAKIFFMDMPKIDVSSTVIRPLLARGQVNNGFLTESVAEYIEKNKLYR